MVWLEFLNCGWLFLMVVGLAVPAPAGDQIEKANDAIWKQAEQAYWLEQYESGHMQLQELVDRNPGDVDLAVKCLERMLREAGHQTPNRETLLYKHPEKRFRQPPLSHDPWAQYATQSFLTRFLEFELPGNCLQIRIIGDFRTRCFVRCVRWLNCFGCFGCGVAQHFECRRTIAVPCYDAAGYRLQSGFPHSPGGGHFFLRNPPSGRRVVSLDIGRDERQARIVQKLHDQYVRSEIRKEFGRFAFLLMGRWEWLDSRLAVDH
jgi:hypothetical protein